MSTTQRIKSLATKVLATMLTVAASGTFAAVGLATPPIEVKQRTVFDGYKGWRHNDKTFRLACGAAITEAPNGDLLCWWLSGTDSEPATDNCSVLARSKDGGQTWSEPRVFVPATDMAGALSALFSTTDGRLIALGAHWPAQEQYTVWYYFRMVSRDSGRSWSAPEPLTFHDNHACLGKPIRLSNGEFLYPASFFEKRSQPLRAPVAKLVRAKTEAEARAMAAAGKVAKPTKFATHLHGCSVFIGRNGDASSLTEYGHIANRPYGLLEPTCIQLKDGTITMLMRAELAGYLWRADSADNGRTWTAARPTTIPNPTSLANLIRLPDGRIALIHNATGGRPGVSGRRDPLSIWVSDDEMKTWSIKADVIRGGALAYPNGILVNGRLVFVYDRNRRQVRFVTAHIEPLGRVADGAPLSSMAKTAPGWNGRVIATIDQSYAGWDVEIGDADNDGQNEILTTGCPDSRLYLFKKTSRGWQTRLLANDLAHTQPRPGMGLAVKIVDLDGDGRNEIILGTGQEGSGTPFFYVFQTDGRKLTRRLASRPACNRSGYTHNLAAYDLDRDGLREVVSAYCSGGEVIRYDINLRKNTIGARKIAQLSGSGEDSLIADVDNDGRVEYITSNSFRAGKARVEIFEFDARGELVAKPRVVLDGFGGNRCFYASVIVGDVDNDGNNELVVGWKRRQAINKTTLLGYRVPAEPRSDPKAVYTFAYEDDALDLGYFEKMMCIADADNDGNNELVVSTRGDNLSERITSRHLGHVFLYKVRSPKRIARELIVDFDDAKVESSWVAVGDANNDGKNEIVLATGKGDRTRPGVSYIVVVECARPVRSSR